MDPETLAVGYRRILRSLYSPREYYRRMARFLETHEPQGLHRPPREVVHVRALLRSMLLLGMVGEGRLDYWRLFFWSLLRRPRQFSTVVTLAIYGFHFRRVFELRA
jgi:hypothetical protein